MHLEKANFISHNSDNNHNIKCKKKISGLTFKSTPPKFDLSLEIDEDIAQKMARASKRLNFLA